MEQMGQFSLLIKHMEHVSQKIVTCRFDTNSVFHNEQQASWESVQILVERDILAETRFHNRRFAVTAKWKIPLPPGPPSVGHFARIENVHSTYQIVLL